MWRDLGLLFCLVSASASAAEPLGRLFLSPDERTTLDELRLDDAGDVLSGSDKGGSARKKKVHEILTLDGYVQRKNGLSTTWVNQEAHREGEPARGVSILGKLSKPPILTLLLPSGKTVGLKTGQTYDVAKGKTREVYDTLPVQPSESNP